MTLEKHIAAAREAVRLVQASVDEILAGIVLNPENESLHANARQHELELGAAKARLARLENAAVVADRIASAADSTAARATFEADKKRAVTAARSMTKAAGEIARVIESLAAPIAEYRAAREEAARTAGSAAKFVAADSKDFLRKSEAIHQALRDVLDAGLASALLAAGVAERGDYLDSRLPALSKPDARALVVAAGKSEVRLSDLLNSMESANG